MSMIKEYINETLIKSRIQTIADQINHHYQNQSLSVIVILEGASVLWKHLKPLLNIIFEEHFIKISSYKGYQTSQQDPKLLTPLPKINFQNVLIVDDIFDTGRTLEKLQNELLSNNPITIEFLVLLKKNKKESKPLKIQYYGFEIEDFFVVGFGLDYQNQYRDLPYIGIMI